MLVSLSQAVTRVSSALPEHRRRQRPRLPPLFLFLGLFGLCLLPALGHFSRDSHVWEAPDFALTKFSSGLRLQPAPRVPPGPAALGAGAGEGALRTPPGVLPRSRGAGDWPREKTPLPARGLRRGGR